MEERKEFLRKVLVREVNANRWVNFDALLSAWLLCGIFGVIPVEQWSTDRVKWTLEGSTGVVWC